MEENSEIFQQYSSWSQRLENDAKRNENPLLNLKDSEGEKN